MVVEEVEVDSVTTAEEEGGAVAMAVRGVKQEMIISTGPRLDGHEGAKESKSEFDAPVQESCDNPQHQRPRADCLQVAPRHLKDQARRARQNRDDPTPPLDLPTHDLPCTLTSTRSATVRFSMRDVSGSTAAKRRQRDELRLVRKRGVDEEIGRDSEGGSIACELAGGGVETAGGGKTDEIWEAERG